MIGVLLAAAISLTGVTGDRLRARAFLDANNVLVGDPLTLTVDFIGRADFSSIHPPALSRHLDRRVWKLDDASARTDTFRDGRRITYRVRPLREGVLWLPGLEFEYTGPEGEKLLVRSNAIPVHARPGQSVVVEGMETAVAETEDGMPQPPDLVVRTRSPLSADLDFDWRKACAAPSAEAFRAFDFPEARLNEARCAILEGKWAEALKLYSLLEWRIGQTPEIERGIVAALAVRDGNPLAELPAWRQAGRPLLRYAWPGRVAWTLGTLAALGLVFWLVGRGIRAMACLAVLLLLPLTGSPRGFFPNFMQEQLDRMHQQMFSGGGFGFGGEEDEIEIEAALTADVKRPRVDQPFNLIVSLEVPPNCSVGQIRMAPSENFALKVTGPAVNLEDGTARNPSNVVKRIAVPVRYDTPLETDISFGIEGMVSGRRSSMNGRFVSSFSRSFACRTRSYHLVIAPLASAGQPDEFRGIVSEGLRIHEYCDNLTVATNDVITISWKMFAKGFVPEAYLPPGAAYEWDRSKDDTSGEEMIEYRGYFVADGTASATPEVKVSYYDPRSRTYRTVTTGATPIKYVSEEQR